ncbi:MAG: MOSC domain-containing protein [Kiloniellales bacterium]|nr:MOSC domain-containing protein [Kiloniellales bacterium]
MSTSIRAIYRYPVKGLSGESLPRIALSPDRALPHDRRFAIARAALRPGDPAQDGWQPKSAFHQLQRDERLAQLRVAFDDDTEQLVLFRHGRQVSQGKAGDPLGRTLLTQFLTAFLAAAGQGAPRLVEARGFAYTDAPDPFISLINLASVGDLQRIVGAPVEPLRFRANLYVEGAEAWEEMQWIGGRLRIGGATFKVVDAIERCAAINVDPETAERDLNLPLALQRGYGHCLMGVYLRVLEAGQVAEGDPLETIA